jgi:hypothetical protein
LPHVTHLDNHDSKQPHPGSVTLSVLSTTSAFNNTAGFTATCSNTIVVHYYGYHLQNEHIRLQAGNTVFQIHAYMFSTESEKESNLADESWLNYAEPMKLEGATADDLEPFCDVLYARFVIDLPMCQCTS